MKEATIREVCQHASSFLLEGDSRNTQDAVRVSELLMMHVLGWDRSRLYLDWNEPFPVELHERWSELLERKKSGEPVQYMIGEEAFYGLLFEVNPAVLIPRPETELLVEAVLKKTGELWPDPGFGKRAERPDCPELVLADVGTGSGAIAITLAVTLAKQQVDWQVQASDVSLEALAVAKRNAKRHPVSERITWRHGDLLLPWIEAEQSIDVLVSNPPYIPTEDLASLQTEVQHFEPKLALDGRSEDGLALYRRMVKQMTELPRLPQLVGFEVGQGQARYVASLLETVTSWESIELIHDLAGIERHVIAWRSR